jgi:uncharacterized protein (DUF433 family)
MGNLTELGKARALIVEDPDILSGTPVIRNTRIPVYDVAASVTAGLPMERILAAYPGLTAQQTTQWLKFCSLQVRFLEASTSPPRRRLAQFGASHGHCPSQALT